MCEKLLHRLMLLQTKVVFLSLPDYKVLDILIEVSIIISSLNWLRFLLENSYMI